MLVIRNGKGRPEVGFGLAWSRKQPRSGICECQSTRNGPLIDPWWLVGSCGTCGMAAFREAPTIGNLRLYYRGNGSIWALAVSVNEDNRPHDAKGQLGLWLEPTRDGTWLLGELAHGGCEQDGGPVRRLLDVVRGHRRVLSPVCEFVEALLSQNIMRSGCYHDGIPGVAGGATEPTQTPCGPFFRGHGRNYF